MSKKEGGGPSTESTEPAKKPPLQPPINVFDWGSPDPLLSRGVTVTPTVFGGDIDSILSSPPGKTNEKKPTGPVSSQITVVEFPSRKGR